MATTNTIIECRQKDSEMVNANGDWTNILTEKVLIEPGDQIAIKSVFIDTLSSTSQNLVLEKDVTLELQNIIYHYDWFTAGKKTPYAPPTFEHPSGDPFILTTAKQNGSLPADYFYYTKGKFSYTGDSTVWGGFNIKLQYTDANGDIHKATRYLPTAAKDRTDSREIDIDIVGKDMQITNMSDFPGHHTKFDSWTKQAPGGTYSIVPSVFDTTITISAGSYSPSDIAEKITSLLSVNSAGQYVSNYPVSSSFLKASKQFPDASTAGETEPFFKDDGTAYMKFDTTGDDYYIGSNQIALEFDQNVGKFYWKYIHMPKYDSSSNIEVQYINRGTTSDWFIANKGGGIAFTSLEPKSFWVDQLGFDENQLLAQVAYTDGTQNIGSYTGHMPYIKGGLVEGTNITGGFKGLDSAVVKSSFRTVPTLSDALRSTLSADQTIPIYAQTPFSDSGIKYAYFLIEIDGVMVNDFIGQVKYSHAISGIVSRYYSIDSFTSAGTESSVPYQHLSDTPMMLSQLKIRILKPDGTLVDDVEDENTIFLQVIKANPTNDLKAIKSS